MKLTDHNCDLQRFDKFGYVAQAMSGNGSNVNLKRHFLLKLVKSLWVNLFPASFQLFGITVECPHARTFLSCCVCYSADSCVLSKNRQVLPKHKQYTQQQIGPVWCVSTGSPVLACKLLTGFAVLLLNRWVV